MIFATNPINSKLSSLSLDIVYKTKNFKEVQSVSKDIASLVYESLLLLTQNKEALTLESLKDLKQTLENENFTEYSAYKVVTKLIYKFDKFSGDNKVLTKDDFLSMINFAVSQSFVSDKAFMDVVLKNSGINFAETVKKVLGVTNIQTLYVLKFLDNISNESISKILSNIERSNFNNLDGQKEESNNGNDFSTESLGYKTIKNSQINFPIDIKI